MNPTIKVFLNHKHLSRFFPITVTETDHIGKIKNFLYADWRMAFAELLLDLLPFMEEIDDLKTVKSYCLTGPAGWAQLLESTEAAGSRSIKTAFGIERTMIVDGVDDLYTFEPGEIRIELFCGKERFGYIITKDPE